FILLIACFNFINLTTAGALARAKETGVQKVLGARRFQLVGKFFTESAVLVSLSMTAVIFLVMVMLPFFNELADVQLDRRLLFNPTMILALGGLLIFISILAGTYPAIFLSRFKSTDVFRNV